MNARRDAVEDSLRDRSSAAEEPVEQAPQEQLPSSNSVASAADSSARVDPGSMMSLQRLVGNQAVCRLLSPPSHDAPARTSIDVLTSEDGDGTDGEYLDATREGIARTPDGGVATPAAPDAGTTGGSAAPAAAAAVPTNLQQIVTSWAPGSTKYGFQLKFQCSSSSGSVADLQAQAPNLVWRETVTYSRNDFSHRISPPSPTILPPGGVSFASSKTTVVNANLLEFNGTTDTHWMPTSAVRETDFVPLGTRALPAIMRSSQVYEFSADGSTWTTFAGPFTLTRTLERASGPPTRSGSVPLLFTTDKAGIHSVVEPYKP